jgi:hypothetical protein
MLLGRGAGHLAVVTSAVQLMQEMVSPFSAAMVRVTGESRHGANPASSVVKHGTCMEATASVVGIGGSLLLMGDHCQCQR